MSNTAIELLNNRNGKQAALTPLEQAVLAEMEEENNAYDYIPTRIKFPSGDVKSFITNDGDTIKPGFNAIVAVSQKARAFWPGKNTQGQPPLCASPDGVAGHFNIDDAKQGKQAMEMPKEYAHPALRMVSGAAGPHDCASCPLALWGSGQGRGQACKSLRRLIVLVEGWTMPAILTLPPTSVKIWDAYASARARSKGQAYFTVWTKIGLNQTDNRDGIKYSVLTLDPGQALTPDETMAVIDVRQQYASLVRSLGITAEDYATEGESNGHAGDVVIVEGRTVNKATGEVVEDNDLPPF